MTETAKLDSIIILNSREVCRVVGGISKMTLHRWMRDGRVAFPPPDIQINGRRFWREPTVTAWLEQRAAQSQNLSQ